MPAPVEDAATSADDATVRSAFKQSQFADEVADWLTHRATQPEVQRFDRYMELIKQATGGSACRESMASATLTQAAARAKAGSVLGFSTTANKRHRASNAAPNRPVTACPSTWQYSSTTKAAAKITGQPAGVTTSALQGQRMRPFSAAPALNASPALQKASAQGSSAQIATPTAAATSPASSSSNNNEPKSVNITTAQASHGLKELYPDLWAATTPICRPQPAPNKNFISEWGESLRQGAAEAWAPYLHSTYQMANSQVVKPTDEFAVRADAALINWAAKQKLYFNDLLSPQAAAAVSALLNEEQNSTATAPATATAGGDASSGAAAGTGTCLSLAEKKGLVEMLRNLSAVVKPDSTQSMSHTIHKPQYSVEQPETTAVMKEQTRIRTMGFPRKVDVKGFAHTATKAAAAAASRETAVASAAGAVGSTQSVSSRAQQAGGLCSCSNSSVASPGKAAPKASEMIDTLKSKVPLKWAASGTTMPTSSYTAAFGGHPGRSPQMFKTVFKEVNVGFGHVDQTLYPTGNGAYPVEQLYLEPTVVPGQTQREADMKTTQRIAFKSRDPESVARSVAAAREQIEASQAARHKSFVPLSKAGIQLGKSKQWCSAYGADFIPRKADLSANAAMAHAVSAMFNGPTIAFGKIAGMRPEDADKIAKWKAQQAAAAAAKVAAEAALDRRAAAGSNAAH